MSDIEKTLRESIKAILEDQTQAKPIKICHYRDLQTFYINTTNTGQGEKKNILCRFFQRGECTKGSGCVYSHDNELLKQQRFKVELCKNFQQTGQCKFKDGCTYAHGKAQLRGK